MAKRREDKRIMLTIPRSGLVNWKSKPVKTRVKAFKKIRHK